MHKIVTWFQVNTVEFPSTVDNYPTFNLMSWKEHNAEDYLTQLFSYIVFDNALMIILMKRERDTVYLLTF